MELCCMLSPFAKCTFCNDQWCREHWLRVINDHQSDTLFGRWICPKFNIDLTWEEDVRNPGLLVRDLM